MDAIALGKQLAELIQRYGVSQAEIGRQLGYSRYTVGRWVRGQATMPQAVLDQLCMAFGVPDADRQILYQLAGSIPTDASDIVLGDKVEGDKVEGDKIIYIGIPPRAQIKATQRRQRLEDAYRESRARCIRRWQAVGLSPKEAIFFADHPIASTTNIHSYLTDEHPLRILIGEIGAGKSLIAERFFQHAVQQALQMDQAPVPVYLSAQDARHGLRSAVLDVADSIGILAIYGATIIIDGADEVGGVAARAILDEARELVHTWNHTAILITSRPMPNFGHSAEHVSVEPLSEQQVQALIQRVAGQTFNPVMAFGWPQHLQEAVRHPLFALLLANSIRAGKANIITIGGLLSDLIEQALDKANINHRTANRLLQRLAVFRIDRGGDPLMTDIVDHEEEQQLLASRLVYREGNRLHFALTIFAEWFAALSLAEGYPTAEQIITDPQQLERWHYSLAMLTSSFHHDQVSRLLCPLAERYPAIAARVIQDGLSQRPSEDAPALPSSRGCGERIYTAMQSWVQGLGSLANLGAPTRADGTLSPLGVRADGDHLLAGWYDGTEQRPSVIELPPSFRVDGPEASEWNYFHSSHGFEQSAWAWSWTLYELRSKLTQIVRQKRLQIDSGPLVNEKLWRIGSAICQWKRKFPDPIPLTLLDEWLSELSPYTRGANVSGYDIDPAWLRLQLARLHASGITDIRKPWPSHDRALRQGGIWSLYSEERQLVYVRAVFEAALESYQQVITTWFAPLIPAMSIAVTLPAKLVGLFKPARTPSLTDHPTLTWWLEPLPKGSKSYIDIQFGESRKDHSRWQEERASRHAQFQSMRPEAVSWIGVVTHQGNAIAFNHSPITDLVYHWLEQDLHGAFWFQ